MKVCSYSLPFFVFIKSLFIFSQSIYFPVYHYESENGLIHLNVFAIQQDNKYKLNAVTQGGVYEYDGKHFEKKQEYSYLKNIRNIFFNDTTTFLVHRDKGLFYYSNNSIKPFFKDNPFKKPCDKIFLTHQYVYNYTDQISIEVFDYKNNIYYNDSLLLKDNSNQAFCIYNFNNTILAGRQKGLYIYKGARTQPIPHLYKTPVFSIFHNPFTHQFFLGSSNKIIIINDSSFKIEKTIPIDKSLPNTSQQFLLKMDKNISKIVVDKFNRIWFCVQPDDNLYLLDNNQIYNGLEILKILPTLINDIYLDSFNNIWIATFNDGIYQIVSSYWQSFQIIEHQKILNIKNTENINSGLFFATNNGLYYADTQHANKIQVIFPADNFFNNEITSLQQYQQKIYCANVTAFNVQHLSQNKTSIILFPFKHIAIKNTTTCYVSDITNNILYYNFSNNSIIDTIFKPTDYRLSIKHLLYHNNQLFISTNKKLLIYNEIDKKLSSILEDKEIYKSLQIDNNLLILYENKIYNYSKNTLFFDAEKYNIITLTDIEKWNNYYFISSEEGLLLLDTNLSFINLFSRKNNIISNVINAITIVNNTIYLSTDKGISYTSIHNLLNYPLQIYPPHVTHITTNSNNFFIPSHQKIFIPNSTKDIYFHIICPNFNPLTRVTYKYSLNNSEWITFENSPLHFSSLPGGKYTLKIKASIDNIHYTPPIVLSFDKELTLYEQKWFWISLITAAVILVILTIIIIKKIEAKKNAEKLKNIQQINLLKHQAMNAILSPHFIFNSLTGIQNYILKNDTEKASDYLSKFSRLIRMIIEKASQPTISLQDEIKRLQFYLELEKERFKDNFDYQIYIDPSIDTENTHIPNMIIQPYLENAILHGILPKKEKGHVALSFQLVKDKILKITIEDDGIGIIKGEEKKSKHHKSIATQTIAEILSLNTQLYGREQSVQIIDKSTLNPAQSGTIVKILIEL